MNSINRTVRSMMRTNNLGKVGSEEFDSFNVKVRITGTKRSTNLPCLFRLNLSNLKREKECSM